MANMELLLDPLAYLIKLNKPHPSPKRFDHGWRTDMLAVPKGNKEELAKFGLTDVELESLEQLKKHPPGSEDEKNSRKRLHDMILEMIKAHTKDLTLMPIRVYQSQAKKWKDVCGKVMVKKMKAFAEEARQSIYHEYDRARAKQKKAAKLAKAKSKAKAGGKKPSKKRTKAEIKTAAFANLEKMAKAKVGFKPAKISRGKHGTPDAVRLGNLGREKHYTPKYVDDSMRTWRDKHFVSLNAMRYEPSPRMYELATHKMYVIEPPRPLGSVEPDALTAKPTPRVLELAIPKARSVAQEADYNEDAFKVSPNALHYVATERIIELSKPRERS